MKVFVIIFLILFFDSGSFYGQTNKAVLFHSVYNYESKSAYDISDTGNIFIKKFLAQQLFKDLTYDSYSNSNYNFVTAKTKQELNGQKKIITSNGLINSNFIQEGPGSFLILYDKNIYIEFLNAHKVKCHNYTQISFHKTGRKKRIGHYNCTEWKSNDNAYSKIHVWACADIPQYINPGLYSLDIKGGIVLLEIENVEDYKLAFFKKSDFSIEIPTCNTLYEDFNMAATLIKNR